MNKDLVVFVKEGRGNSVEIPVLESVFHRETLENITRNEVVEIISSEPMLAIYRYAERLGRVCSDEELSINLLQIVEFYDIDYLGIIRKRLRNLGITKHSLLMLFELICGEIANTDILSVIEEVSKDERFLSIWMKAQHIVPSVIDLIYLFRIDEIILVDELNKGELIPVEVDDTVKCNDLIIKFENFKK
jgi:hypothetical protein